MNRRTFLAASIGVALAGKVSSQPGPQGTAVRLAEVRRLLVERVDPLNGRCRYVAEAGARRVVNPILTARAGEACDLEIRNALPQPTTAHFHGLTLSEAADGAGFDPIPPGEAKRVRFEVRNRAGLYWVHPHPHAFTGEQVYGGLVAPLVVSDAEDDALDAALALRRGNRMVLALADTRIVNGRWLSYAPTMHDCIHGWMGNRMFANGMADTRYVVQQGWVRLQLLNACNARGLLLAFRDGEAVVPFQLLGTDGGLLAAPREVESVLLHGAERVDLALDVSGRDKLEAVSLQFDPRHNAHGPHRPHQHPARKQFPALAADNLCAPGRPAAVPQDGAPMALFQLLVSGEKSGNPPSIPSRLSRLAEPAEADLPVRRIRLDSDQRGFLIDETPYQLEEKGYEVKRGAREIWEVRNSPISMPHPMHLHGFGFRVLRRQGTFGPARRLATEPGGRLPTDLGIKDTVTIWPNELVRLAVDFSLPAAAEFQGPQRYMFHCHNLEHEDGMMMRNLVVA